MFPLSIRTLRRIFDRDRGLTVQEAAKNHSRLEACPAWCGGQRGSAVIAAKADYLARLLLSWALIQTKSRQNLKLQRVLLGVAD